ncbi:MAG: hypothetical protein GY941_01985 [Planctomycetes bacterium]|nr:hypothetical protein [Planctomycetota bacterium]
MKKQIAGVLIGLGLSLIMSGSFTSPGFALPIEEQCGAYEVCTKNNGMVISNVFFGLRIEFDTQTGQLVVAFDQGRGGFKMREGKNRVGLVDNDCGAKFIAKNFEKVPGEFRIYTVKNDKKPVELDFSLSGFRDDCRRCTTTDTDYPDTGRRSTTTKIIFNP